MTLLTMMENEWWLQPDTSTNHSSEYAKQSSKKHAGSNQTIFNEYFVLFANKHRRIDNK